MALNAADIIWLQWNGAEGPGVSKVSSNIRLATSYWEMDLYFTEMYLTKWWQLFKRCMLFNKGPVKLYLF
jgi:hypothetical protein